LEGEEEAMLSSWTVTVGSEADPSDKIGQNT
jgi:hypothetical protein